MVLRLLTLLVIGLLVQWSNADIGTSAPDELISSPSDTSVIELGSNSPESLLVLGDSISAAYGIDKAQGWVALLEKRLAVDCPGLSVHNASVSGETTAGGRMRMPDLLARFQPSIVVIELGGNDGLRGLSPAKMQSNLQIMIRQAKNAGAEPVLLGILMPPNYGEHYRDLFQQAMLNAATLEQVALLKFFLDGVAGQSELMQEDGIHPVSAAQPKLLANAWQVLEEPLRKVCKKPDISSRALTEN